MTDQKISALTDGTMPADTDDFVIARTGSSLKLTWAALKAAIGGGGQAFSGVGLHLLADATGLSSIALMHWTATDYDTDSYLHVSGDYVVVPFDGVYSVTVCTSGADDNGLDGYFDLSVTYQSTPAVQGIVSEVPYAGANGEFDVALADTIPLHAGDTIQPTVNLRVGSADTYSLFAAGTRFAVTFLGAP